MPPGDIKLPDFYKEVFAERHLLRREWSMDPPPYMVEILSDKVQAAIYRAKMEGLAEISKLEARAKEIEANVFEKIGKAIEI